MKPGTKDHVLHDPNLYKISRIEKSVEAESRFSGCLGIGVGNWRIREVITNKMFQVIGVLDCADGCTYLNILKSH